MPLHIFASAVDGECLCVCFFVFELTIYLADLLWTKFHKPFVTNYYKLVSFIYDNKLILRAISGIIIKNKTYMNNME